MRCKRSSSSCGRKRRSSIPSARRRHRSSRWWRDAAPSTDSARQGAISPPSRSMPRPSPPKTPTASHRFGSAFHEGVDGLVGYSGLPAVGDSVPDRHERNGYPAVWITAPVNAPKRRWGPCLGECAGNGWSVDVRWSSLLQRRKSGVSRERLVAVRRDGVDRDSDVATTGGADRYILGVPDAARHGLTVRRVEGRRHRR